MQEGNLHKWFKGSKSKDGKSGWVNVVTGGTCASDKPGEGTPKCVSSSKRASMTPAERKSAQSRKKKADPNQQSKSGAAKPTYVKTDSPRKMKESKEIDKIAKELDGAVEMHTSQAKRLRKHSKDMKEEKNCGCGKNPCITYGKKEEVTEGTDKKGSGSGKKDACYHKVKASASVWPSAYASGRLVQCRKKGAANYGKSKKNEEFMALPEFTDLQIRCMEAAGIEVEVLDEKCWVGYTQKGMKKKGKRVVPNCVKVEGYAPGDVDQKVGAVTPIPKKDQDDAKARILAKTKAKREKMKEENTIEEATRVPAQNGNVYLVGFTWRGKYMMMKLFFPEVKRPSRNEVKDALEKIYPGCHLQRFDIAPYNPSEPMINVGVNEEVEELEEKSAAWQRKEGKNKKGGLNEKGRKSYERENPGSDLKAPQPEGGPRKRSFCARMGGVKGPMKKPNGEPTRKALALRKWKC